MPLKPIFEKAPLTALNCQPLRAGMVRAENATLKQLYALIAADERPAALEPAFRLACIVTARPEEERVTERIHKALAAQQEDGSYALSAADSIAVLRAGWALYEFEARKPLLEPLARWCGWAVQHWDEVMADNAVWAASADLMELLENLYRVTGKAALLNLCERVSSQAMAWSAALNTISIQRPTHRSMDKTTFVNGLATEKGSREGFYGHFLRTNSPECLADGARSTMANGWYSGSATELNATRVSWERLERHHGAICGGLTADELLEGTSPSMAVSTAALGAWAEALCAAATGDRTAWVWDAVERMVYNAMPATLQAGQVLPMQRVNSLTAAPNCDDCFYLTDDLSDRALLRLVRGYAAVYASTVMAYPNGLGVNMYLSGRYAVPVGEQLLFVTIAPAAKGITLTFHCKQDVRATLRLRVPNWSRSTDVTINGGEGNADKDCTAGFMPIDRTWHDGDVVTVSFEQTLRLLDGHHQGKYLYKGPILMALAANETWAYTLLGATLEDGFVRASVDPAADWKAKGDVPADVPVLPAPSGTLPLEKTLTPYAQTPVRIALFPGRQKA